MSFLSAIAAALISNARKILKLALGEADKQPSSPTMPIIKIPPSLTFYELLSGGAVGWVYKINDQVALKYPTHPDSEGFKKEMAFFDILERHEPCPGIIQSFLRVPEGNFLAFMGCGSLHERLQAHQRRSDDGTKVEEITGTIPADLIKQWLMEVCNAAAWLESLGYVHGDIRPPNLLLDSQEHLKLADFDCVAPIGAPSKGAGPPWARVLGAEAGSEEGTFGAYGSRTEQFAIGSVLYCLTRGHEPFEMEDFDDITEPVNLLQRTEFPRLGVDRFDIITERCWKGQFILLRDLSEEAKSLYHRNNLPRPLALTSEYCSDIRSECQRLVESGLLAFN